MLRLYVSEPFKSEQLSEPHIDLSCSNSDQPAVKAKKKKEDKAKDIQDKIKKSMALKRKQFVQNNQELLKVGCLM